MNVCKLPERRIISAAVLGPILICGCAAVVPPSVGVGKLGIDNFSPSTPADQVYRGAQPNQEGVRTLAAMGIRSVINLRETPADWEASEVRTHGMQYFHLPTSCSKFNDASITRGQIVQFLQIMRTCPKPVFVHCADGKNRTGLFIAVYRQVDESRNPDEANAELHAYGHDWTCPQVDLFLRRYFKASDYARAD